MNREGEPHEKHALFTINRLLACHSLTADIGYYESCKLFRITFEGRAFIGGTVGGGGTRLFYVFISCFLTFCLWGSVQDHWYAGDVRLAIYA